MLESRASGQGDELATWWEDVRTNGEAGSATVYRGSQSTELASALVKLA